MLASFRFGNLGLFPQDHRLDFKTAKNSKGNLGIFVGANATGKSSCLEFIRRCLSETVNHRKSTVYNREKPGWALANFKIDRDTLYKYGSQEIMESVFGNLGTENIIHTLWAGVIFDDIVKCTVRFIQLDKHDGSLCVKVVTSLTGENPRATYQRYGKAIVTNDEIPLPYPEDLLNADETNNKIEKLYCSILGVKGFVTSVFDQRGVGAIASTRNIESSFEEHEKNYSTSEKRAVLVQDLLREVDARDKRNEYEKLATRLTMFRNWKFEITESGKLKVHNSDTPHGPVDILKVPTGVYEAHLISLLFTTTIDYSTVIIDDPSRGMDLSMTGNLREIIIDFIRNKPVSVIISTHAKEFVSHETWDNIYRFSRCIHRGTLLCHHLLTSGLETVPGFDVDEIRKWFFASSLILVEGKTDRIVIKAMLCRLQADDSHSYYHSAGAQVIQCKGCNNIENVYTLVKGFGVPIIRIYDADADCKKPSSSKKTDASDKKSDASGKKAEEKMQFTENQRAKLKENREYQESVYVNTGKNVSTAIRVMLNKSYVLQNAGIDDKKGQHTKISEETRETGSSFRSHDSGSLYLDLKVISDFGKVIRPYRNNLEYFCENLEEFREPLLYTLKLIDYEKETIDIMIDPKRNSAILSFSEIGHLLMAERLLSPVWDIDDKGNHVEMPFYWGCGTIEDVINFTLRKEFHNSEPPKPWFIRSDKDKGDRKNYIWYCQKNTFGKIDALSPERKTELIDMLLKDLGNTYFQKFLDHFNKTYQSARQ